MEERFVRVCDIAHFLPEGGPDVHGCCSRRQARTEAQQCCVCRALKVIGDLRGEPVTREELRDNVALQLAIDRLLSEYHLWTAWYKAISGNAVHVCYRGTTFGKEAKRCPRQTNRCPYRLSKPCAGFVEIAEK